MQVLHDIVHWAILKAHEQIVFGNPNARPITLKVNAEKEVALYIHLEGEEDPRFLATFKGRDTLKFVVPGRFTLINATLDVDAWVLSSDSSKVHRVAIEEEVFTTLHEPRARDENLERMMQAMQRNIERRVSYQMAAQQAEHERELERLVQQGKAAATAADGDDGDTGETPSGGASGGDGGGAAVQDE
ncbi:hypothetical protein [Flyfo microvirus Tbat2_108]|nr:hypothetical protein [Flyfo microvirus Tbat2_108]